MVRVGTDARHAAAQTLLDALTAGDEAEVAAALRELDVFAQSALYQAVGSTARALHDELVACARDPALLRLVQRDAPDARVRLDEVITLTDAAAHRTLDAVERARPRLQAVRAALARLDGAPAATVQTDAAAIDVAAMDEAAIDVAAMDVAAIDVDVRQVDAALGEILLAQEFQDLTGQLIRRSIALLEGVEQRLLGLLTLTGVQAGDAQPRGMQAQETAPATAPGTGNGFGPRVAGAGDVALGNQQEVDDLLESLGF